MKLKQSLKLSAFTLLLSSHAFSMSKPNSLADLPFANKTETGYELKFNPEKYRTFSSDVNGQTVQYRAFEKIVYVQNPVDADYQYLNVYVPEGYFNNQQINGFNAQTAPIFFPNAVGGYMPAMAAVAGEGRDGKPNAILTALSKGYVVVAPGARGRTLQKEEKYTGKAPAAIVDLKAAVRYLHWNDKLMAGDANKIISNGTSAGGALSALLGVSGDSADYTAYLQELGAAEASDGIFAVSAYCPITNLEHADSAYEWQYNGLNEFSRVDMSKLNARTYNDRSQPLPKIEGTLTESQIKVSNELKAQFPAYVNSLNLHDKAGNQLSLDEKGEGAFKTYLEKLLVDSANQAQVQPNDYAWLKFEQGKVVGIDWNGYIHSEKRMKSPPAFDALDLSSGENDLFGDTQIKAKHFTAYGEKNSQKSPALLADENAVKLMNAMNYVQNPVAAKHYRIRHGSRDRDTSLAIPAILALSLEQQGKNVDFAAPWGVPHSGDYDLEQLFQWADSISR